MMQVPVSVSWHRCPPSLSSSQVRLPIAAICILSGVLVKADAVDNLRIVGTYDSGQVLLLYISGDNSPSSGPEEAAEVHTDEVS